MLPIIVILIASVLLFLLLLFEKQKNHRAAFISKGMLSSVFVITAFLQPSPMAPFTLFLIFGLILCLAGDLFLGMRGETTFKLGLVSFLLGHVLYIVSFSFVARYTTWISPPALIVLALSAFIFNRLRPYLKKMAVPVFLYILVITVMVLGALAAFSRSGAGLSGRAFILAGAFFFYFSDIFVARDKFIRETYLNRLVGLPLYYAGQFLLAFSPGYL